MKPSWLPIETAPEGVIVHTIIRDERGERNDQKMVRHGNLWWEPSGKMYVYYRPTHWRLI